MIKRGIALFALCSVLSLVLIVPVDARRSERSWQNGYCAALNGRAEVQMRDLTRVDCITEDHAIEFDFARKWCEAIGQSLHYALLTGKKAGIALIMESGRDQKHLNRLLAVIRAYELPIDVFIVGEGAKQ